MYDDDAPYGIMAFIATAVIVWGIMGACAGYIWLGNTVGYLAATSITLTLICAIALWANRRGT